MNLPDLLAEMGADNLTFQLLNQSLTGAKQRKDGLEVSFMTNQTIEGIMPILPGHTVSKVGLVVWVDAAVWDDAVARLKQEGRL